MKRSHREDGQAIVFFTVFLVVLLSFLAVVVDGGMYMYERREMQGAADATAMAAVRELPSSVAQATTVAEQYAESHNSGSGGQLLSIDFSESSSQVEVVVGKTGNQSFGALLGMSAPTIDATATARVQMMGSAPGMLPMAFMRDGFTIGVNEEVKFDENTGTGNRGLIDPLMEPDCSEANGANDGGDLIRGEEYGGVDACATAIGDTLETAPGFGAGQTRQAFVDRLVGNSQSFSDVFQLDAATGLYRVEDPDSPRVGVVPVIENIDGTTNWPNGASTPIRILGYMLVYVGDTTRPPDYPATTNGKSVYVTPVEALLPQDFAGDDYMDYDEDLPAPVVFRLID